jgi:hypothetical protein
MFVSKKIMEGEIYNPPPYNYNLDIWIKALTSCIQYLNKAVPSGSNNGIRCNDFALFKFMISLPG